MGGLGAKISSFVGYDCCLGTVAGTQFSQQILYVTFNGLIINAQSGRSFLV